MRCSLLNLACSVLRLISAKLAITQWRNFWKWKTFSRGRHTTEWLLSTVMMCNHMLWSIVGLPSFTEAEQALKMSPSQDAHLKLSERKYSSCRKFKEKDLCAQRFLTDDDLQYSPKEWLKGQSEVFYFTCNAKKLRSLQTVHWQVVTT